VNFPRNVSGYFLGYLQSAEVRLFLYDCYSCLIAWRVDFCHQTPVESADKPLLQRWYLSGWTVGAEDDLFAVVIKGVKSVKEFLLALLSLAQKLHIVDYKHIYRAKLAVKAGQLPLLYRRDESVHEIFAAEQLNYQLIESLSGFTADRVQQMCFSQPRIAVNKKRIICISRRLAHGHTACVHKTVARAYYEIAKRVIGMKLRSRLAAAVVALFEDIIAKITILAIFLPVVAGQGGNAGAQSLAIVMRGLVMREIPSQKIWSLILKESWLGVINGAAIGTVTALVAWLWNGNPFLGLVIGLGMLVNLFVAGLSGASIPIVMKYVGLDPAQSSSIILTTVTDVVGFFAFLGFAVVFQQFLV